MEPTEATIYKAGLRDTSGDGTFISAVTTVSPLFQLHDEALAIGKKRVYPVVEDTFFVLIPISGGVDVVTQDGHSEFAGTHELLSFYCKAGTHFILFNPFTNDHVNVLLASYKGYGDGTEKGIYKSVFSLETRNALQLLETGGPRMAIGVYNDGIEGIFETNNAYSAFVVNGHLEIEGHLLESRDALHVPDVENVRFRALSDDAIVLLTEWPS